MIPIITFCGASGSGKTTLVSQVIAWFVDQGFKVGAIKHHGHSGPVEQADQGKDSQKLRQAGANPVALCHQAGVDLWFGSEDSAWGPAAVAGAFMAGLDLVIAEGFKGSKLEKIEVVGQGKEAMLPSGGRLLAIVGVGGAGRAQAEAQGLPWFDADEPAAIAEFVRGRMKKPEPAPGKVEITIDGRKMPLNDFVQQIVANTVRGLLASLKGGEVDGPLELHIE